MKPRVIVIDGKTYNSISDMPEEVRKRYHKALSTLKDRDGNRIPDALEENILGDKNRNGIPDLMEHTAGAPIVANSIRVLLDGQEFNSLDDLPPEARAKFDQAMSTLDSNHNGLPDFMEGIMKPGADTAHKVDTQMNHTLHHAPRKPMSTRDIAPDTSNGWMLALLGAFLLFVCAGAVAGLWYFFLR